LTGFEPKKSRLRTRPNWEKLRSRRNSPKDWEGKGTVNLEPLEFVRSGG